MLITESGATIAELIDVCTEQELSGLEHFAGIPSSIGGAMRQNLHFLSPDRKNTLFISNLVIDVQILNSENNIRNVEKEYFEFGYDDSILHHTSDVVLSVRFLFKKSTRKKIEKQIKENLAWRNAKQPQLADYPSCGSVFKKIEGVGAGRLIERAGLKGKRIGGAEVSSKHANYIVNIGNATAKDVKGLIHLIQREVKLKTGYFLEPEISFVGEE
jgi:UDP-N-acetylmuramate dehydrogenase